jgi:hypothetical protein
MEDKLMELLGFERRVITIQKTIVSGIIMV